MLLLVAGGGLTQAEAARCRDMITAARGGQTVLLPFPPTYINVEVQPAPHFNNMWVQGGTLVPGKVVVPIATARDRGKKKAAGTTKQQFDVVLPSGVIGSVSVVDHAVQLAFSVTYHKCQVRAGRGL